jgi:hypothetical protein
VVEVKVIAAPNSDGFADGTTVVLVSAALTTCNGASSAELLSTFGSPLAKPALTGWLPTESVELLAVARPLASTGPAEPRFAPSRVNWTEPEGGVPGAVTCAENVTSCPKTEGFAEEEIAVVDCAPVTTSAIRPPPKIGRFPSGPSPV